LKLRALLSLASIVAVGAMGTGVAGASTPIEYFTISGTSSTAVPTVVAAGPISATGTSSHRVLTFPDGTVKVRPTTLTKSQTFDSRTCTFTFSSTGVYVIVGGTGAYAHVSGSGHFKQFAVGTGCDPKAPPTSFSEVIQAHGPLTLG
jgi:hypothetical protein